jgi:hypothetical protein
MKKILPLLFVSIVWLSGCKKEDEIDPNFADSITGRYALTYYREGMVSINLPTATGISGYFDVARVDNTHIDLSLTLTYTTTDTETDKLSELELRNDTGTAGTFSIYYNSQKLGTISSTDVLLGLTDSNGEVSEIRAKR